MDVIFILLFPEWSSAFEILIDWYFIALVFVDVPTVFLSDHSMTKLPACKDSD